MRVIHRKFFNVSCADTWTIVPIGDIHLGARACDEDRLKRVIDRVAKDDRALWIGLGDYCDFVNVKDPRFAARTLAEWISVADLEDLAGAQEARLFKYFEPIAGKCLGLLEGNHETAITKYSERAIFANIVTRMKEVGGFKPDDVLGIGYYGWLQLHFYRSKHQERASVITLNLHHGFTKGKLAGAKALDMQRWLWTHDADIVLFGHSHNTASQIETVQGLNDAGNPVERNRIGAYGGTFLKTNEEGVTTYSEQKGYFPTPQSGVAIHLHPHAYDPHERVTLTLLN